MCIYVGSLGARLPLQAAERPSTKLPLAGPSPPRIRAVCRAY